MSDPPIDEKESPTEEPPVDKRILDTSYGKPVRMWLEGWPDFQRRYGTWLESLLSSEVMYLLEPDVIEPLAEHSLTTDAVVRRFFKTLAVDFDGKLPEDLFTSEQRGQARSPFLTKEQREAELALYHLCERHHADCVGVAYGVPVLYMFLGTPLPYPEVTQDQIDEMGWQEEAQAKISARTVKKELEGAKKREAQIRGQLTAYAGVLVTTAKFRRERDALRDSWQVLPENARTQGPFALPLKRLNYLTEKQREPYVEMGDGFLTRLEAFFAKWALTEMTTWDLPSPQGPLEGIPAGAAEHLTGRPRVIAYYPPSYQVPSKQDLHKDVREAQEREARALGQPDGFPPTKLVPRGGDEAGYARALRMYFTELAYRRRYGDRRGLRSRFAEIFEGTLGLGPERVRQLQQLYAAALDEG